MFLMIENFVITLNLFPLVGLVLGFLAIVVVLVICCTCYTRPGYCFINGRWQQVPCMRRAHETSNAAALRTSSVSTGRRETSFNTSAYGGGGGGGRGSSGVMYSVAEPQPLTYTDTTSFPPIQIAPPTAPHMPQVV